MRARLTLRGRRRRGDRPPRRPEKAKTKEALASKEQLRCKAPQAYRVKGPIERPKPKLRKLNESEKRLRALNKQLRDIEAIQKRETDGETLDEQQLAKVDSLGTVLAELEGLITGS